jgi:hypothetical protein
MMTHDTPAVFYLPSRCSSELIKNLRISLNKMPGGSRGFRLSSENPRKRGREKCRRSPGPEPL